MFKKLSVLLTITIVLASLLCGCSTDKKDYYNVNQGDVIKIGVVLPTTDDTTTSEKFLQGIKYAAELAPSVQIDKTYNIELVIKDSNSNYEEVVSQLNEEKVAAVIALDNRVRNDKTFTDCFDNSKVPVIFADVDSSLNGSDNTFTLSSSATYQASTAASYLLSEGYTNGAVICAYDDEYNTTCADSFEKTFTSNGGKSVTKYFKTGEKSNYDAKLIIAGAYEFIYINADDATASAVYTELRNAGVTAQIITDEVFDKTFFENEIYSGLTFISRFEEDDNNYIGSDFMNNYSQASDISVSEVTAASAYGYDAYMCIYNSLIDFNKSNVLLGGAANNDADTQEVGDITVSKLLDKMREIEYFGVTDSYNFNDKGVSDATHLYIDRVNNSSVIMLDRYDFGSDET